MGKEKLNGESTKHNISIDDIKNLRGDTIEFFSRLNLSLINSHGSVKPIKFSEDFDNKPLEWQVDYLKALTASQNIGMKIAYEEKDKAIKKMEEAERQKENADKAVEIHKNNLVNGLTQQNEQIQILTARLKQLESDMQKKETVIEELNAKLKDSK